MHQNPFKLAFIALLILLPLEATHAFELAGYLGAIHLPKESYHRLGYAAELGFSLGPQTTLSVVGGTTHKYKTMIYRESIMFADIRVSYDFSKSLIVPTAGFGLGAYADVVSRDGKNQGSPLAAFTVSTGLRLGSPYIGLHLKIDTYFGTLNGTDFILFQTWPLINTLAGLYVRF